MANEMVPTIGKHEFLLPAPAMNRPLNRPAGAAKPNLRNWLEEAAALIEKHGHEISGWNRKMSAILSHFK